MLRVGEDNHLLGIVFIDIAVIIFSHFMGHVCRFQKAASIDSWHRYAEGLVCVVVVYLVLILLSRRFVHVLKNGYLRELIAVIELNILLGASVTMLLYFLKISEEYSRGFYVWTFAWSILLMYAGHLIYKKFSLLHYRSENRVRKVVLLISQKMGISTAGMWNKHLPLDCEILGVILLDEIWETKDYYGLPVLADKEGMYDYIRTHTVDEVLMSIDGRSSSEIEEIVLNLQYMGIVVNLNMELFNFQSREKVARSFGSYQVLTYSSNAFDSTSVRLKRWIDIIGSIVGLILTGILFLFVAPAIWLESPGPIFFSQMRVGRSGRRFKIYKFRSMYMDAEQRKAELMSQNQMQGSMFKMKNDPRITKVGKFIRKWSIDEFPQFLNVFKGEMSLVGTRPPTVDEFLAYTNEQKRRLTLKPGITGFWQTSGRSDITDFEEIMRLDLEYIDQWWIGRDIKVLLKTVGVVALRKGAE